jgi:hypothetical protein
MNIYFETLKKIGSINNHSLHQLMDLEGKVEKTSQVLQG